MERERECHILKLHEYCRICGENFPGSVKSEKKIFMRRVEKFTSRLDECFRPHVSTSKDISEMHPSLFCNTCYRTMTKFEEKQKKGESYFHSRVAIQWRPHLIQGQCLVCKKNSGGRKPKRKGNRGLRFPSTALHSEKMQERFSQREEHDKMFQFGSVQEENAPPSLTGKISECLVLPQNPRNINASRLNCPICLKLLDRPVLTPCQHAYCFTCLQEWCTHKVLHGGTPDCTVCKETLTLESIKFSAMHYSMLCELIVYCPKPGCNIEIQLDKLQKHVELCEGGQSTQGLTQTVQQAWTNPLAIDLLNLPVGGPIPLVMEEVLTHGVHMKQALADNQRIIKFRTGGSRVNTPYINHTLTLSLPNFFLQKHACCLQQCFPERISLYKCCMHASNVIYTKLM